MAKKKMPRSYYTPPHDPRPLINRLASLGCAMIDDCEILSFEYKCLSCQSYDIIHGNSGNEKLTILGQEILMVD